MTRLLAPALSITLLFTLVLFTSTAAPADEQKSGCLLCHGNAARMQQLGFPHFTVTAEQAQSQTGMPASCSDCHLGNPEATDRQQAHQGMGRLIVVRKKGLRAETIERRLPLEISPNPESRLKLATFRNGTTAVDPSVNVLLYQDKKRDTLSQDFTVMEKTCGACHRKEFAQFRKSTMARNAKQSSYRTWNDPERGPHNCGVWFDGNRERIAGTMTVPFSAESTALNQRSCNACHVGCLDCHYNPSAAAPDDPRKGMHAFLARPEPQNCYGGGRGTICHAGPEERRRGAGYFGGAYSFPEGAAPDIHAERQVGCLDCHANSGTDRHLGHAMVKRQATCDRCHAAAVASHARSAHRRLSCEACHIQNVGGYQATFWGPGKLAGVDTPFFKFKNYYGIMKEPILIRDQGGRWIPVKPFPMAAMNQKTAKLKPGLHWRWPKDLPDLERTDDAWGYVGLRGGLPENNKALLWIQMDKVSHKYGPSRGCDSCHDLKDGTQRQEVSWEYTDAGAFPFSGRHTVVAGRSGLAIRGMTASEKIEPSEGQSISSFAPWVYLQDAWSIPGDFSIPAIRDRSTYEKFRGNRDRAVQEKLLHR